MRHFTDLKRQATRITSYAEATIKRNSNYSNAPLLRTHSPKHPTEEVGKAPMPDDYELRGRYTAVEPNNHADEADQPPRPPLDNAYYSSTSSDEEDIDEFDPLNYDGGTLKRKKSKSKRRPRTESTIGADRDAITSTRLRWQRPWSRLRSRLPGRSWCGLILLFIITTVLLLTAGGLWAWKSAPVDGRSPPWYPAPLGGADPNWEESYRKATELVGQMTLVEKVNVTTGTGWMMGLCVGNTGAVDRLGFPSLCLQDGPLGLRFADHSTAFPAGITVGATWNKQLMYKRGKALGTEARLKGVNVLLGPSMGPLGRMPAGGRNWEGFGADPVLQGLASAWTIAGIQSEGVMATAKHFVGNEQEHFRQSFEWGTPNAISSNIDDRTLHELYAWPFADSIRAGVASVMCAYNQVNNSYACQNSKLLNGILKDELGFQGYIQSDWLAQRSGVASAIAGLDMSMPGDGLRWQDGKSLWGAELTKAVLNSSVPMQRINDMATRIVAAWYQLGQDDKARWPLPEDGGGPNFSSWTNDSIGLLHPGSDDRTTGVVNKFKDVQGSGEDSHGKLARQIAAEGTVLVKNDNDTLPIRRDGASVASSFQHDAADFKFRIGIYGEDSRGNPKGPNGCADRGCNEGTLASGWGSGAVEFPYLVTPLEALKRELNNESVVIHEFAANDIPASRLHALEQQDMCFVFINSDAGEGFISSDGINGDRNDLYAQKGGDALVKTVASRCGYGDSPVVVVVHAVGPVILENWISLSNIKSVLLAHLPGEESGNAIADIIFGDVNPSGRLPYTVAKDEDDYGPGSKIMYYPNGVVPEQNFTEGIYVDYRWFDARQISPRYEFGYGLSYTKFHLSELQITIDPTKKTLLPAPRPDSRTLPAPPTYSTEIPAAKDAILPDAFRKLKKYVYPYISSESEVTPGEYPYPEGWNASASLSPAGGAQGGNPDLYTIVANVSFTITNLTPLSGAAVPQLYISYPEQYEDPETKEVIEFPVRVLRAFEKVPIGPGPGFESSEQNSVRLNVGLSRKDLSYWDTRRQNWVLPATGSLGVWVGWSSRDLVLSGTI